MKMITSRPAEKSTSSTDWKIDFQKVLYNHLVGPSVCPWLVSENDHGAYTVGNILIWKWP